MDRDATLHLTRTACSTSWVRTYACNGRTAVPADHKLQPPHAETSVHSPHAANIEFAVLHALAGTHDKCTLALARKTL